MICNYSCKCYHVTLCFFMSVKLSFIVYNHLIAQILYYSNLAAGCCPGFHSFCISSKCIFFFIILCFICIYLSLFLTTIFNCIFAPSTIVYYSNAHILLRTDSLYCVILSFAMCVLIVCKFRSMYKYYFKFHYTSIITLLSMGVHFVNLEFNH